MLKVVHVYMARNSEAARRSTAVLPKDATCVKQRVSLSAEQPARSVIVPDRVMIVVTRHMRRGMHAFSAIAFGQEQLSLCRVSKITNTLPLYGSLRVLSSRGVTTGQTCFPGFSPNLVRAFLTLTARRLFAPSLQEGCTLAGDRSLKICVALCPASRLKQRCSAVHGRRVSVCLQQAVRPLGRRISLSAVHNAACNQPLGLPSPEKS